MCLTSKALKLQKINVHRPKIKELPEVQIRTKIMIQVAGASYKEDDALKIFWGMKRTILLIVKFMISKFELHTIT